jgi:hypothetical protein
MSATQWSVLASSIPHYRRSTTSPKDLFAASEHPSVLVEVAAEAEVAKLMSVISIGRLHPLVFSVHELIEACFPGPNESPRLRVHTYLGLL